MAKFLDTIVAQEAIQIAELLAKETREVNEAQQEHKQTTQLLYGRQLELQRELASKNSDSNAISATILADMQTKMSRVEQIEQSPFLSTVEPIAGKFSKNFSRKKLAQDIGTDQTRLNIKAAQDNLWLTEATDKLKLIEAEKNVADAELLGEQQDVITLTGVIAANQQITDTRTKHANMILTIGSVEQIQDALDSGIVTEKQVTDTKRLRKSQKNADAISAIQVVQAKRNERDSLMKRLNDDALVKADLPARVIKEERNRRSTQSRADGVRASVHAFLQHNASIIRQHQNRLQ